MDFFRHNREAWDREVADGNPWTVPVTAEQVADARRGKWSVLLTSERPVPRAWFPDPLDGCRILCLAGGGGQQGPILAAAGADVTVFDASPAQLARDREVAERDALAIETVEGDMADLGPFADEAFDLVFHPCSNCFAESVLPVWREARRVLRHGGLLLSGFTNPVRFLFRDEIWEDGSLEVAYPIPFVEGRELPAEELERRRAGKRPLQFGHTLEDQVGGQIEAGFVITGFYEDRYPQSFTDPLSEFIASFIATRAVAT